MKIRTHPKSLHHTKLFEERPTQIEGPIGKFVDSVALFAIGSIPVLGADVARAQAAKTKDQFSIKLAEMANKAGTLSLIWGLAETAVSGRFGLMAAHGIGLLGAAGVILYAERLNRDHTSPKGLT